MKFDKSVYFNKFAKDGVCEALKYLSLTTPKTLYKFYSLGSDDKMDLIKLKTLKENKIWVDLFKNKNDPFEMINFNINEETVKDNKNKNGELIIDKQTLVTIYQKNLDFYKNSLKFASFTQTMETNIAMWAYYANNHKGFCCMFDIIDTSSYGMINIKPIFYESSILKLSSGFVNHLIVDRLNSLIADDRETKIRSLTNWEAIKIFGSCKDPSWSHEREYRIFYIKEGNDEGETVDAKTLNIELKAIYIGLNCSKKNEEELINISEALNVPIYKMNKSVDNYSLVPIEIKKVGRNKNNG
ncbi:MAG: DUF2971 domain-containing protein [Bacilli bacterium]|nr:DUF2971 domain-containing protein [Bacilli bacterium]